MRLRSIILAYAWAVPLAAVAFLSSRGIDGNLKLFLVGFALVGLAYVVHNLATPGGVSRHHLGHAIVFCAVVTLAALIDSTLDGMAGMLYVMMPAASLAIVVIAAAGVWLKNLLSRRSGDSDV